MATRQFVARKRSLNEGNACHLVWSGLLCEVLAAVLIYESVLSECTPRGHCLNEVGSARNFCHRAHRHW